MKTRKLNKKTGIESLVIVGSLMAGFMVSGAVDAVVPTDKRTIARVGTAGAGAAGAALLPSTDTTTTALKMLSAGAAARAGYMLATDELKKSQAVKADANTLDKAWYGAIGLACPCDGSRDLALNAPLDYPELNVQTVDTVWNDQEQNYQVDKGGFAA